MSEQYTSGTFRIELLKGTNWMPWKRRMLAIFWELNLEKYIAKDVKEPEPADKEKVTETEKEAQRVWRKGDAKTQMRIELVLGDSEMIHISSATTAAEMWNQLITIKEACGKLRIIAMR